MYFNQLAWRAAKSTQSIRRTQFAVLLLLLLGLSSWLSSCGGDRSENIDNIDELVEGRSTLTNTATNVRITVPDGWAKVGQDLRQSHDIYTYQPGEQLYATVLSEDEDVLSQFDLADNAEQYRQLIRDELESYEGETQTSLSSIDGHQAIQYEIRGTVDGQQVVYLHTTLRGDDGYYQVVGWTTADRYRESKDVLDEVIESFEET